MDFRPTQFSTAAWRRGRTMARRIAFAAILAATMLARVGSLRAAGPAHSIVLPPVLVAEAPATLAVLDVAGRLVPGAEVALSDGHVVKTDASGRARWVVPATPGDFQARIQGGSIVATAPIEARDTPVQIQLTDYPSVIDARDQFTISGTRFQGDADENHVWLGGEAALVLAASPAALVLLPSPDTPLGPTELRLEDNGQTPQPVPVTVVELDAIDPAGPLHIGQSASLIVRVRGSTQPLEVELTNWSPAVVKIEGQITAALPGNAASSNSNVERVRTSGGDKNQAEIAIVPLASGKFSVHARLARPRP
jgi:hypothetical protein